MNLTQRERRVVVITLLELSAIIAAYMWARWRLVGPERVDTPASQLIGSGEFSAGNPDVKLTLIEFGDYQCPPCKQAEEKLRQMLISRAEVRFVFRNLPSPFHPLALREASIVESSTTSQEYWQRHNLLFAAQATLDESRLDEIS
jgi:Na+:H+ antiporter, NhaA family